MECSILYRVLSFVGLATLVVFFTIGLVKLIGWIGRLNGAIEKAERADERSADIEYRVFDRTDCIRDRLTEVEARVCHLEKACLPKLRKPKAPK